MAYKKNFSLKLFMASIWIFRSWHRLFFRIFWKNRKIRCKNHFWSINYKIITAWKIYIKNIENINYWAQMILCITNIMMATLELKKNDEYIWFCRKIASPQMKIALFDIDYIRFFRNIQNEKKSLFCWK